MTSISGSIVGVDGLASYRAGAEIDIVGDPVSVVILL
jgi:hypothetical protein